MRWPRLRPASAARSPNCWVGHRCSCMARRSRPTRCSSAAARASGCSSPTAFAMRSRSAAACATTRGITACLTRPCWCRAPCAGPSRSASIATAAKRAPSRPTTSGARRREFQKAGVEAVVIAFFNSYLDPAHEAQAAQALARCWPTPWVTCSAEIAPVMGEYERTSTAVLNAYITPRTVTYLQSLNRRLLALGLQRPLLLIQSNGGAISVDQVATRPVTLLLVGPGGRRRARSTSTAARSGRTTWCRWKSAARAATCC